MKRIAKLLLLAALAAWTTAAQAGMGILWSTGSGWVVAAGGDPDSGPGVAASDNVTWQLVYAGPDGVANAVDLSAANWTGGDDVLLAVRSIPAGGGIAVDDTSWDEWLFQQDGDATYVDLAWPTDRGGYVFQRIFQGTPSEGTPYAESGLFAFNPDFAAGATPDIFSFPNDGNGFVLDRTIPSSVRNYPLWVGGTQVTSANATNILGDGTASFVGTASGGMLSLSNAVITNAVEYESGSSWTAGIYAGEGFDLAISLDESNRVENAKTYGYGITAKGNLSFGGVGVLTAAGGEGGYGIYAGGNLRIEGATVAASGDYGLWIYGNIVFTNATVSATGSDVGIYASRSATFSGESRVEAETTWTGGFGWAIYAQGGITVGAELNLVEPDGGGLEANGQRYFVDAGGHAVRRVRLEPAVVAYDLWVGGVQVTSANKDNILGDGTAWFVPSASGGTLSLSNATVTATHPFEDFGVPDSANVFSGEGFDLAISLTGSNILQNTENTSGIRHDYGIRSLGNLAITGDGALVAGTDFDGAGIEIDGDLLVDGADVTAHSSQYGISVGGGLAISNAVVTANGVGYGGISGGDGGIDIADSVVTVTGYDGIDAHGYMVTVSGASVVTAEATWDEESERALVADPLVLRDGLAITEPAGGVFDEGAGCVVDPATGKAALRVVIAVPPPVPPSVSNVVARQRWPWNGLVDVDYEVGGCTTGLEARLSFAASDGRSWVATNFLAGAEPSAEPGFHRATWDAPADGATNVVAPNVVATVELVREEPIVYNEFFYEIGGESDWSVPHPLYGKDRDGKYLGYYYLNSGFKFRPNAHDWNGDYEFAGEGRIADNGGANCPAPEPSFYRILVDLADGTYALEAVRSITVVGTHNSWNVSDLATHLSFDLEEGCWTIDYTFSEQTSLKFAMNDDWSVSWGGANGDASNYDDLTENNGKDLSVASGKYRIKLYLSCEGSNRVAFVPKE